MNPNALNRALLRIVGIGWAAFAIAAVTIRLVLAAPEVTLLVDRSYCPPGDWQAVAQEYETLYQQDRQGQITIQAVILFSDLGEDLLETPPSPDTFQTLTTYGRPSADRQAALEAAHPNSRLLTCGP